MRQPLRTLTAALVLALLACWGTAPAQAQPPDLLADMAGFLSAAQVTGHPSLVVKPESIDDVLLSMSAVPLGDGQYHVKIGANEVIFDIYPFPNPPALLSVPCPGMDCELLDSNPDLYSITYRNRSCYREKSESSGACVFDAAKGLYSKSLDPAIQRCRLQSSSFCTEYRSIGWRFRYFLDSCCKVEATGVSVEKHALRCVKCP